MQKTLLLITIALLSGCSMLGPEKVRHSKTTSLVNFLYPNGHIPKDAENPTLHLPLRVGLAYVPDASNESSIDVALKLELLESIKHEFNDLRYVQSIEIIPEIYLSNRQSKDQLSQLQQMYQLDVMALVSYDQIVNRKENLLALTYLTIVGNYIFPGSHFKVSTMIDMALIDLKTKRLLFRAAGTNASKGLSAEAYTNHQYDKHQNQDFTSAMLMMRGQLAVELHRFEQRLKAKDPNDDIKVVAKKGYDMSFNLNLVILLSMLLLMKMTVNYLRTKH